MRSTSCGKEKVAQGKTGYHMREEEVEAAVQDNPGLKQKVDDLEAARPTEEEDLVPIEQLVGRKEEIPPGIGGAESDGRDGRTSHEQRSAAGTGHEGDVELPGRLV